MLCGKSGEAGIPGEHLGVGDRERVVTDQVLCWFSPSVCHPVGRTTLLLFLGFPGFV